MAALPSVVHGQYGARSGGAVVRPPSGGGSTRYSPTVAPNPAAYTSPSVTPEIDPEVLTAQYGLSEALINRYPEIRRLFEQAVAQEWTEEKFIARMENTNWWRTRNKKEREWIILNATDPATARQTWVNEQYRLNAMLNSWGIPGGVQDNKDILERMVWGTVIDGWSDAQVKFQATNYIRFSKEGILAGEGGEFQQRLSQLAYANGVSIDPEWYRTWYKGIMRGSATEAQAVRDIRNRAAAQFSGFRDQILAGQNVIDLASPYIQGMSQILELNPGELDLFTPEIRNALNYRDDDGKLGSIPLWKFQTELRKDSRWNLTNNAREAHITVGRQVLQDMGMSY